MYVKVFVGYITCYPNIRYYHDYHKKPRVWPVYSAHMGKSNVGRAMAGGLRIWLSEMEAQIAVAFQ